MHKIFAAGVIDIVIAIFILFSSFVIIKLSIMQIIQ